MPLPPLVRLLDPRPASVAMQEPISDSVNIPLQELQTRMHELPPRHGLVLVAAEGALAGEAAAFLRESGRQVEISSDWSYGLCEPGRLWRPNPFLEDCLTQLTSGMALDLACGTGRDAVALAGHGWQVTAIDHLPDALALGKDLAARYLSKDEAERIQWIQEDLEFAPLGVPWASRSENAKPSGFDLITIFWYLNRELVKQIPRLLAPGGSFLMETFTSVHRERFGKPRTEAFVLQLGELRELVAPLTVRFYEEGWHDDRHSARLWATRSSG